MVFDQKSAALSATLVSSSWRNLAVDTDYGVFSTYGDLRGERWVGYPFGAKLAKRRNHHSLHFESWLLRGCCSPSPGARETSFGNVRTARWATSWPTRTF